MLLCFSLVYQVVSKLVSGALWYDHSDSLILLCRTATPSRWDCWLDLITRWHQCETFHSFFSWKLAAIFRYNNGWFYTHSKVQHFPVNRSVYIYLPSHRSHVGYCCPNVCSILWWSGLQTCALQWVGWQVLKYMQEACLLCYVSLPVNKLYFKFRQLVLDTIMVKKKHPVSHKLWPVRDSFLLSSCWPDFHPITWPY